MGNEAKPETDGLSAKLRLPVLGYEVKPGEDGCFVIRGTGHHYGDEKWFGCSTATDLINVLAEAHGVDIAIVYSDDDGRFDEPERPKVTISYAALDVMAERERQETVKGHTPDGDDCYIAGQLAKAAAAYCLAWRAPMVRQSTIEIDLKADIWPWKPQFFTPRSHRENLVRAGALILAEIERLDRLEPREGSVNSPAYFGQSVRGFSFSLPADTGAN